MSDTFPCLRIADVGVSLDLDGVRLAQRPGHYVSFFADGPAPDIRLRATEKGRLSPHPLEPVFEVPGHWRLHREDGRQTLELWDPLMKRPNRVAKMNADLSEGVVTLGPEGRLNARGLPVCERPRRRTLATILDPLLRILLIDRVGRTDGLMLHAAAFDVGGVGLVFAGASGTGKSTLSRLFADHCPGATVLGDEHIVLRQQGGKWTVHGTPWPGMGFAVSPGGVPLSQVYLIHHDRRNRVYEQPVQANFSDLLAQTFLPRWNGDTLMSTLSRLGDLAQDQTQKLGFVNTPEVIDYLQENIA
jgi:hypothetical protein